MSNEGVPTRCCGSHQLWSTSCASRASARADPPGHLRHDDVRRFVGENRCCGVILGLETGNFVGLCLSGAGCSCEPVPVGAYNCRTEGQKKSAFRLKEGPWGSDRVWGESISSTVGQSNILIYSESLIIYWSSIFCNSWPSISSIFWYIL